MFRRRHGLPGLTLVKKGRRQTLAPGAGGFDRSDIPANLCRFFEVKRYYIAHAAIAALAEKVK